jgi:hypothetical protein
MEAEDTSGTKKELREYSDLWPVFQRDSAQTGREWLQ